MKRILLALALLTGFAVCAQAAKPSYGKQDHASTLLAPPAPTGPTQATKQLFQAVYNSNFELADMLLSQGADINCTGCTPPTLFTIEPVSRMTPSWKNTRLTWLLEHGATPNVRDTYGRTALMASLDRGINIYWSNASDTAMLLQHGADVTLPDSRGFQALHYLAAKTPAAANSSNQESVEMNNVYATLTKALLERGADINAMSKDGTTPLMNVAQSCNPAMLDLYLSLGANPQAVNTRQENALKLAIDKAVRFQDKNCNAVVNRLRRM